uniref:ShlB/FhaC/HecB family hemolysin secretion/activation protein n=1 Tax=Parendozoicomonas sp. Alg238-R29 TaxID=2993446 RepID=UPI00248E6053
MLYALRNWCAVALFGLSLLPAHAVEFPSNPGDRDLNRQRQEQLLKEQADKLRELQKPVVDTVSSEESVPEGGQCFDIRIIDLQGVTLLPERVQRTLTDPLLNTCMGIGGIDQLIRAITNLYVEKGFITTRAYVPEQNLKSGTLTVLVVEGVLSLLEAAPESDLTPKQLAFSFPKQTGSYLNIRELEQGMDQLNRLPSNAAQLKLLPGQKPGETAARVSNTPSKPWRLSIGKHNNGDETTGDRKWQGQIQWDNPLGVSDQMSVSLAKDAVSDRYKQSRSVSLDYSVPYGYWNLAYNFSYSDYDSRRTLSSIRFALEGNTRTHKLRLSRVLHRDQSSKTSVS